MKREIILRSMPMNPIAKFVKENRKAPCKAAFKVVICREGDVYDE
jgi:hypothetical protein